MKNNHINQRGCCKTLTKLQHLFFIRREYFRPVSGGLFPTPLQGFIRGRGSFPGVETPGWAPPSLRDFDNRACPTRAGLRRPCGTLTIEFLFTGACFRPVSGGLFPTPLQGFIRGRGSFPGVETPGYTPPSLRDFDNRGLCSRKHVATPQPSPYGAQEHSPGFQPGV